MADELQLSRTAVRKLIGAANPDAALLYLYLCAGGPPADGQREGIQPGKKSIAQHGTRSSMAAIRSSAVFPSDTASKFSPRRWRRQAGAT